jgi:hypothetical protein
MLHTAATHAVRHQHRQSWYGQSNHCVWQGFQAGSDHSQPGICRNKPPGCAVCLQSPSYAVCLLHTDRSQLSRRKCKLSVPQKLKGSRWVGVGRSLGSAASGYKLPSQICSSDVLEQTGFAGRVCDAFML